MILIFTCSSFSKLPSPGGFNVSDKLQHFAAYAILGFMVYVAIRGTLQHKEMGYHSIVTILLVALYGMADEFHQYFIPGRNCEFGDWLADVAGGVAVITIVVLYHCLRRKRDFGTR